MTVPVAAAAPAGYGLVERASGGALPEVGILSRTLVMEAGLRHGVTALEPLEFVGTLLPACAPD